MKERFFKFPTTPHLALLAEVAVRADKVLPEAERDAFLRQELTVEEKVDGANLGISFDSEGDARFQNRGEYLHAPFSGQWKKLSAWLAPRREQLREQLREQYILFGEWCYACHSVPYDRLDDWFLGFDIYDKGAAKFLSCRRRKEIFQSLGIAAVPFVGKGRFSLQKLQSLLAHSSSSLGPGAAEGLYLRADHSDDENWLELRAKLVAPAFLGAMQTHWSRAPMKANRLRSAIPPA